MGPVRYDSLRAIAAAGWILGYSHGMENDGRPDPVDEAEDDIERAIDGKREDILAADITGMVGGREGTRVVDLATGEDVPAG